MEKIDCTPTWEGILPLLLDMYEGKSVTPKSRREVRSNMLLELQNMAKAADMWNEHVKSLNN